MSGATEGIPGVHAREKVNRFVARHSRAGGRASFDVFAVDEHGGRQLRGTVVALGEVEERALSAALSAAFGSGAVWAAAATSAATAALSVAFGYPDGPPRGGR